MRLINRIANIPPHISASTSKILATLPGTNTWIHSSRTPKSVTATNGIENIGILGLGLNLSDSPQINNPKMQNAPKWAALSSWGINPRNLADGWVDSKKRMPIQLIIVRLSRMIVLALFAGVGAVPINASVKLAKVPLSHSDIYAFMCSDPICRYHLYTCPIPSLSSIFACHPNALILETSRSFLGVPSGFELSKISSP